MPRLYSAKAKFLRRCFKAIAPLHVHADRADEILDRADALATTRNDLMHSVVTHVHPIRGEYRLSKIDIEKDRQVYREVIFASRAFPKLAEELLDLGRDAGRFGLELLALERRVLGI
jgi:hypothetical protein